MAVELLVEGEEALQVAALGREGRLRLPGDFGDQVEGGQVAEAVLAASMRAKTLRDRLSAR